MSSDDRTAPDAGGGSTIPESTPDGAPAARQAAPAPEAPQTAPAPDAPQTAPAPDAPHVRTVLRLASAMQRVALVLGLSATVVALTLAVLLRGGPGLTGAAVGAVIGLGIGLVGTAVMRGTARATPGGVMVGALASFAGKFVVLLVFLLVFRGTTLFDNQAFAFTLLGVTAAWIAGEVVGFVRAKAPSVDV